jgi:hypothetical protein
MFGDRKFTMLWANFTDHDETHKDHSGIGHFIFPAGLLCHTGDQIPEV